MKKSYLFKILFISAGLVQSGCSITYLPLVVSVFSTSVDTLPKKELGHIPLSSEENKARVELIPN